MVALTVRACRIPPLFVAAVVAAWSPAAALAGEGGGVAPPDRLPAGESTGGGTKATPGERRPDKDAQRERRPRRRVLGPVLTIFELQRTKLFLYGRSARVSFRIEGGDLARAQLVLLPEDGAPATTIDLGELAAGDHALTLKGTETGVLAAGRYLLKLSGSDRRGRRLRHAASASRSAELELFHHRFPLVGQFDLGGADARFGAKREGHRHQGQDIAAAEGTPVVAPRGGVVETVRYQAEGAGHYVVVDGEGEDRDYVFMHLRDGSIPVERGQRVRTGQRVGEVGNTGRSFGAHLHFEIWVGGWYEPGGEPVDPLPLLARWAPTRSRA